MSNLRCDASGSTRQLLAALCALAVAIGWLVVGAVPASADGPTTYSNSAAIVIPAIGSPNQVGPSSPYPSTIAVSGMTGLVTAVTLTLNNLTHAAANDIDALVVAPSGQNIVVMSDVGDPGPTEPSSQLVMASNINVTFSDSATGPLPRQLNLPGGTYLPTNSGGSDLFPGSAPTPSAETTLAGAFTGTQPNGDWKLYVVDDNTGDIGTMAGGWSLTVATEIASVATTTTVSTSQSSSATGNPVTFTASVAAAGPVMAGSVQFSDGATALGSPVVLDGAGRASLTTSALSEGTHQIRATYGGAAGFLSSNGSVTQRVDNRTVATGNTFCNTGPVAPPGLGSAEPYPSHITVSGLTGTITKVTANLTGVSHQSPMDLDVLLSGPTSGTNVFLLSDSGGVTPVSDVDVTFDDDAATGVPAPLVSGTFRPTNSDDGSSDAMPAPAPTPSSATGLSAFNGASANGQWSLWVVDDASADSGSIAGGWCLTVTTETATTTTPAPSPSPSASPSTSPSASPSTSPTPSPTPSPTRSVSPTPTATPTVKPTAGQTDLYSTPGYHDGNGRRWFTVCERYSQTVRCRTAIWATQVAYTNGAFHSTTGWYFNNLTYLPYMARSQWVGNPLGHSGQWGSVDGRQWRTECDTAVSGGNGCRSWIWSRFITSKLHPGGHRTYYWTQGWVFNNIVRFR